MFLEVNDPGRKFIETEPIGMGGEHCEQKVWDACKRAFSQRECIGYWRYPIFSTTGETRKEPDILIVDKEVGLVVIEVKGVKIDQIASVNGHLWQFNNFYQSQGNPYQQAENQLFALLGYCDRSEIIRRQVRGRVIVALPLITQQQWQQRGFDQLPSCPPIIFGNQLGEKTLLTRIEQTTPVQSGSNLNDEQWSRLLAIISGTSILKNTFTEIVQESNDNAQKRAVVVNQLRDRLHELDLEQVHIGLEIPPGAQRIRGIAGSGKTVLLCQKAAHMHLKHPDWDIALVFFTRSLYDHMETLVDKWLRYYSCGEIKYAQVKNKLKILHAWGAINRQGFYRTLCEKNGQSALTARHTNYGNPNEKLADISKRLLKAKDINPMFDAVLIDEGQDLVVDPEELKYEDKQVIYWMAYQSLRPCDPEHPEQRRLIWAYDEAQSLESAKIPSASELFGNEPLLRNLVTGRYKGNIKKSEVMKRCYRTPGPILIAAHGIGMGLLRPGGMISGLTSQEEWRKIGYEVEGDFRKKNEQITLTRPLENSPNLVPTLWDESVIKFNTYFTRQQELTVLAQNIKHNLEYDGLERSRQILVLVLGDIKDARYLENEVAQFLIAQGIDIYIPSATRLNQLNPRYPDNDPDSFWYEGGVTVSRIHRAKGNEADMVYVIGCDSVARNDSDISLRNQLFVALTRARGWVNLSGIGDYPMYDEINKVINSGNTLTFVHNPETKPLRDLNENSESDLEE